MKKVLSFVLVLTLVLGSFSMAFATTPTDVVGTTCEKAVTALTDLSVINGYEDGSFKPANDVTRAEAAKMVITALGLGDYAAANTTSFADCQGHWAAGYIGYAESLGILKGVGDNKFNPNGKVTYQELATMLVRAVGYNDASLPGTWPANYVTKAKALGMMADIMSAGATAANRGDVAIMLYNSLNAKIGYVNADNEWVANYTLDGANSPVYDTMMSRLDRTIFDIDKSVATKVTGAAVIDVEKNVFVVTGEEPVIESFNLKPYVGAAVIAYANADNEITGIKEVKSTFVEGEFSVMGTISANDKFYADDVTYKIKSNDATFVKLINGSATTTAIALTTAGIKAAVKVDGNYITEVYSVADWTGTTVQMTESQVKAIAKNDKLCGKSFAMTSKDEIDTASFALLGVDSLSDIAKNDVVTYYLNGSNLIERVEVSKTTVEGTITKVGAKYTINGTAYKKSGAMTLALGDEGTFFLDYAGKIFAFEGVSEAANYAMTVKAGTLYSGGAAYADNIVAVKLFTADGVKKDYNLEDGTSVGAIGTTTGAITTTAQAATALPVDRLVTYTLNKDGEAQNVIVETTTAAAKYSAKGFIDGKEIANNVVVFVGSGASYTVGSLKDLPVNETLNATCYVTNADGEVACIITDENQTGTYAVVTDVTKVKNTDDKTVAEVVMLVDGKEVTYLTENDVFATYDGYVANGVYDITLNGGLLANTATIKNVAAVVSEGAITDSGIKNNSVNIGNGFVQVADTAVVYQVTYTAKGTVDTVVVSDFGALGDGDYVYLYELDDDVDGYDIVVFVAEDDKDADMVANGPF